MLLYYEELNLLGKLTLDLRLVVELEMIGTVNLL